MTCPLANKGTFPGNPQLGSINSGHRRLTTLLIVTSLGNCRVQFSVAVQANKQVIAVLGG